MCRFLFRVATTLLMATRANSDLWMCRMLPLSPYFRNIFANPCLCTKIGEFGGRWRGWKWGFKPRMDNNNAEEKDVPQLGLCSRAGLITVTQSWIIYFMIKSSKLSFICLLSFIESKDNWLGLAHLYPPQKAHFYWLKRTQRCCVVRILKL